MGTGGGGGVDLDASDCPRIIDATAVFLQLLWPNPERYSERAVSVRVWTVCAYKSIPSL